MQATQGETEYGFRKENSTRLTDERIDDIKDWSPNTLLTSDCDDESFEPSCMDIWSAACKKVLHLVYKRMISMNAFGYIYISTIYIFKIDANWEAYITITH